MFVRTSRTAPAALALALGMLCSSCVLAVGRETRFHDGDDHPDGPQVAAGKDGSGAKGEKSAAAKAKKRAQQQRALELAELELQVAQLEAEQATTEAGRAVEEAHREVDEAQRALAHFQDHVMPHELAEAQLALDRADHRRELAKDELDELISMYAAEEFAELTKELVLKRGRKDLEFAERALVLQQAEQQALAGVELPRRRRDLEHELQQAQNGLADAEAAQRQGAIETQVKLLKARHELEDLRADQDGEADDADGEEA